MLVFFAIYLGIGLFLAVSIGIHAMLRNRLRSELLLSLAIGCVFLWPVCLVMAYQFVRRELKREKDESTARGVNNV